MGDTELVVASPEEIGAGIGDDVEQRGNAGEKELQKSPSIRAPVSEDDANGELKEPEVKQEEAGASDDVEDEPPKTLMPIRAPVSVDPDEDGANGSAGSGESFDSALERIAGSSTASFDTAASPKAIRDEEAARVMPKAMLTADDKQGSNSSSSGSELGEPEEENDNEDEGGASSVADNEVEGEVDQETYDDASAQGLRVLGAEPEEAHDDHQPEAKEVEGGDNDDKRDQDGVQGIKQSGGDSPELKDRQPQGAEPEAKDVEQESEPSAVAFLPGETDVERENEPAVVEVKQEHEPEAEAPELERGKVADELPQEAAPDVEEDAARVEEPDDEASVQEPAPVQGETKEEPSAEVYHPEGPAATEEEAVLEEGSRQNGDGEKPEEVAARPTEAEKVTGDGDESGKQEEAPAAHQDAAASTNGVEEIAQEPDKDSAEKGNFPESTAARGDSNTSARVEEPADDEDSDEDDDAEDGLDLSALRAAREPDEKPPRNGAPSLGSAGPSLPAKPTAAARSLPSLDSAPRASQTPAHNPTTVTTTVASASDNPATGDSNDENNETREKLQDIRVKFLRLANRLGQSAHNVVVAQVLYRLGLAEQLRGGRASRNNAFSFERANAIAEELEASGEEELDFACTIMVLGKSGVGKSATINSLFDEVKTETNAFTFATKSVQEITGTVHGIKVRVIDTPGLLPAVADQRHNERIMSSVKRFIKKSPPDIVLYFDRLDMQNRDYGDLPLLRTITDTFGAAIWFNAIVVLTHASTAPPDGPNGLPLSYEMFVAQRSHVVQQTIRQAAGDMRLMNPVSLVENHSACRTNRAGERVLPNGQVWKPQLLLLCFASKILAEANSLLKLQESTPGKPFSMRSKVPPLPFLLSSLLQSRTPLKMPDESMNDDEETDDDMDVEDSDGEEEYDDLPPFRRLTKEEIQQLDKKNRASYFEELRERERLFQKKQWKEELRRRKEMKRRGFREEFESQLDDGYDDDAGKSAAVPVPMPDMALPPTFDSDNPTHRYRYLETANQWLVRPVLETHGWDHDSGYDGLNVEKVFVLPKRIPASISGQITKDKKEANVTMECAASLKHGEGKFTQLGLDAQTVGKDMSYTIRSETRFNNWKKNKTIAGLALTMLGDTLAGGMKLEDRFMVGRRLKVVLNGGALTGKGEVAYGGTMEICLRDKDFPIGRTMTTLGFSVMNWHGDLAVGGNLQTQLMVGRTMVVARGNLNNRGAGTITIKASSSEQLQMALVGLVPLLRAIVGHRLLGSSHQ